MKNPTESLDRIFSFLSNLKSNEWQRIELKMVLGNSISLLNFTFLVFSLNVNGFLLRHWLQDSIWMSCTQWPEYWPPFFMISALSGCGSLSPATKPIASNPKQIKNIALFWCISQNLYTSWDVLLLLFFVVA